VLPIIHIDRLAEQLNIERRWIIDHWINRENTVDSGGPAPHFRDGHHVFFPVKALEQWAESRAGTILTKPGPPVAP